MDKRYVKGKPQNTKEKRKDWGNIIITIITIITTTMTMTDSRSRGIDRSYSRDRS